MRPGEIIALQWKHVEADHVSVEQRIYRGKVDRPKTSRSKQQVALSPATQIAFEQWRKESATENADSWVFPS
jgi:integrase